MSAKKVKDFFNKAQSFANGKARAEAKRMAQYEAERAIEQDLPRSYG